MNSYKVLLVDDDAAICKVIKRALKLENIDIISASNGKEAYSLVTSQVFDLIILDVSLGDTDGFQILKRIRTEGNDVPVIFLSGNQHENDKILALGMGADDYITKPFSIFLLVAKIKAHLRRGDKIKEFQTFSKKITQGPFVLDTETFQLFKNEREVFLSSKEIMLMKFFMENPNIVFSKDQLYEKVWNNSIVDDNTIMVYMRHLRKKLEDDPKSPKFFQTVWGIGYKFNNSIK